MDYDTYFANIFDIEDALEESKTEKEDWRQRRSLFSTSLILFSLVFPFALLTDIIMLVNFVLRQLWYFAMAGVIILYLTWRYMFVFSNFRSFLLFQKKRRNFVLLYFPFGETFLFFDIITIINKNLSCVIEEYFLIAKPAKFVLLFVCFIWLEFIVLLTSIIIGPWILFRATYIMLTSRTDDAFFAFETWKYIVTIQACLQSSLQNIVQSYAYYRTPYRSESSLVLGVYILSLFFSFTSILIAIFINYASTYNIFYTNYYQARDAIIQKNDGSILKFCSDDLKSDPNLVRLAVRPTADSNGIALYFASSDLYTFHFLFEILSINGLALRCLPLEFQNRRTFVLCAIQQNALALQFATSQFRKDEDVVSLAVQLNPRAFQFAHFSLRNNKQLALRLLENNKDAQCLQFLSLKLKKDKHFGQAAINIKPMALEFFHHTLKKDLDLVLSAFDKNRFSIKFASTELQKNKEFFTKALLIDGRLLHAAHPELKKDKDLIRIAISQNPSSIKYAAPEIQQYFLNRELNRRAMPSLPP